MPVYNVGYTSCEDSGFIQLESNKVYNQEEFNELVMACIPDALKAFVAEDNGLHLYREYSANPNVGFDVLYKHVVGVLCSKYDFKEVEYIASFSAFGWANLLTTNDWTEYRNPELDKLNDVVIKAWKDLGLHREEDNYKYFFESFYSTKKDTVNATIRALNSLGIPAEIAITDEKYTCMRFPREFASKLPDYEENRKQYTVSPHAFFKPLWYTEAELESEYGVKESDWVSTQVTA